MTLYIMPIEKRQHLKEMRDRRRYFESEILRYEPPHACDLLRIWRITFGMVLVDLCCCFDVARVNRRMGRSDRVVAADDVMAPIRE